MSIFDFLPPLAALVSAIAAAWFATSRTLERLEAEMSRATDKIKEDRAEFEKHLKPKKSGPPFFYVGLYEEERQERAAQP